MSEKQNIPNENSGKQTLNSKKEESKNISQPEPPQTTNMETHAHHLHKVPGKNFWALIVNIPGREIVNSYMYGMCIMSFLAPTGLILPSLAMVNISLKTWVKFIMPLLIILSILCAIFLVAGINL